MPAPGAVRLDRGIAAAAGWLLARQDREGWWCGELEADVTLESYMVLLDAFLFPAEGPSQKMRDLARVIRGEALPDGGFAQYPGGPADLSVSCLAYLALKLS